VAQAYAALVGVITSGEGSGMIAKQAGDALLHAAEDMLHAYQDGHVDDALKRVDQMQKKVDQFAGKGQIASDAEAASIQQAITAFANAMQRAGPSGGG